MKTNPILVTGSHRSGTTWVGRMLDQSTTTYYLGEIFNPDYERLERADLMHSFHYIPAVKGKNHNLYEPMLKTLTYEYDYNWPRAGIKKFLPRKRSFFKHTYKYFGLPRPIMKDPIAVFSAEWLAHTFDMSVLCLVRHPAAFAYSLKKVNWDFNFKTLLNQQNLMEDWLHIYEAELSNPPNTLTERAALCWKCIYYVLYSFHSRNKGWRLFRHKDISVKPITTFKNIYNDFGIPFNKKIERSIQTYSNSNHSTNVTDNIHQIRRNSRDLINEWKIKLKSEEIYNIRKITEPIASIFYSPKDWLASG